MLAHLSSERCAMDGTSHTNKGEDHMPMSLPTAREVFARKNMSPNFMTPNRAKLLTGPVYAVEVSTGYDMEYRLMWGVTVRRRDNMSEDDGLSKLFQGPGALHKAGEYAREIARNHN